MGIYLREILVWLLCAGLVSGAVKGLINSYHYHIYISLQTKQKCNFKQLNCFSRCTGKY